jgi:sugar lactone lactonase YvrE
VLLRSNQQVLLRNSQGFYYANGVALSHDESYVVMAETDQIRVLKVWVEGPKVSALAQLPGSVCGLLHSHAGHCCTTAQ